MTNGTWQNNKNTTTLLIIPLVLILFFIAMITYGYFDAWADIKQWKLSDSDDAMRLLEVRAWLDGQGFYDHMNHRANPPYGSEMHWSRISDAPLAVMELILKPFFNKEMTEKLASFFLPPIIGIFFLFYANKTANKLYYSNYTIIVLVVLFLSSSMLVFNFNAGRIDHHNIQSLAFVIMLYGIYKNNFSGGMISGISLGLSLAIGFELLPVQVISVGWIALIWAINPQNRANVAKGFTIGLGVGILSGFLINISPDKYLVSYNDSISIAQIVPIIIGTIGLFIAAKFFSNSKIGIRFLTLVIIGVAVIIAALQFPELRRPLYWQIEPIFVKLWFGDVGETFPLKKFPLSMQLSTLGVLITSGAICLWQTFVSFKNADTTEAKINAENWSLLSLVLVTLIGMTYFFQMRVMVHALAIGIIAIAPFITRLFNKRGIISALLATILLGPSTAPVFMFIASKFEKTTNSEYSFTTPPRCRSQSEFAHLANLPKGLVASNISMGIETLLTTPHDVMATHFHRDTGRNKLYQIYLSPVDKTEALLKENKVDYVAYCNHQTEVPNFQKYYPDSFLAQISIGHVPKYLKPIAKPDVSDIYVFEVVK